MPKKKLPYALIASALLVAVPAEAATVVGGNLLSASDAEFVGGAIASGPLTFTLVYDHKAGDRATAFHAAADPFSRTVTVVRSGNYLFGGYNPLTWAGGPGYKNADSAFIFSLDKKTILTSGGVNGNSPYEIYANPDYFPTFGGGHDLFLGRGTPTNSYSNLGYSYTPPPGTAYSSNGAWTHLAGSYQFAWSEMEVYAVTDGSAVPEPSTWAMMLLGFGFVGGAMRSAKRRQKLTVSYA